MGKPIVKQREALGGRGLRLGWLAPLAGLLALATLDEARIRTKIKLILTGNGRSLLTGARTIKLIAKGAFTPAGQVTIGANRRLTLRS